MLSLSSKSIYSLAALLELALSYDKSLVSIKEIAEASGIPEDYLRQLLILMKRAGLVESSRGTNGGYKLKRPPALVTVGEIIAATEGPFKITTKPKERVIFDYLMGRQKEVEKIFNHTLEQLIAEKQRYEKNIVYNI